MMQRDLAAISDQHFDLIVIGGGIFGVCAAWDAAQRGLKVAILERRDFAHASSAHSMKMVHGGIRYLQHGDLYRLRESNRERRILLRIAPHLVRPLPIVVPTYGRGKQGKAFLMMGGKIYDLLALDRNWGIGDPDRRVPPVRGLSRSECLNMFPDLDSPGLTGGVLFHDGQMYNPQRLVLSFLHNAVEYGAVAANYVEVTGFLRKNSRIVGVEARDLREGGSFSISGALVLNACGSWAPRLLSRCLKIDLRPEPVFSRDVCFVVPRRLTGDCALAIAGATKDPDAILSRNQRHLFLAPWRDYTLVGVWHGVYEGDPDNVTVPDDDLRRFLAEVNDAYGGLNLRPQDVLLCNAGLTLFGRNAPGATDLSYGKRSRVVDHRPEHGLDGLVTLIGVRYTTARGMASRVIDLACRKLGRKRQRCRTAVTPVHGGQIDRFGDFLKRETDSRPASLTPDIMRCLLQNYGSTYGQVLDYLKDEPDLAETLGDSKVIKAEVIHAIRNEMAQKLSDVVFRRTELGTGGDPGEKAIRSCGELMAAELGWDSSTMRDEMEEVAAVFTRTPSS